MKEREINASWNLEDVGNVIKFLSSDNIIHYHMSGDKNIISLETA